MTSERQIATNRRNGRKSRGPRSAAGKFIASRNALHHGLAAITHRAPMPIEDVERFAEALCGEDKDPKLLEHALAIAQEEYVLRAIGEQQRAVVDRLHEPTAVALARGDNSIKLAKVRSRQAREAYAELINVRDALAEEYKDQLPNQAAEDDLFNVQLTIWLLLEEEQKRTEGDGQSQPNWFTAIEDGPRDRDETEAIEEAAPDLIRLDRYERRARARQNRALWAFINIRLMNAYVAKQASP
jgi:hypothetical protein